PRREVWFAISPSVATGLGEWESTSARRRCWVLGKEEPHRRRPAFRMDRPAAVSVDRPFPWEQQRGAQRRWRDPLSSRYGTSRCPDRMPALRGFEGRRRRERG